MNRDDLAKELEARERGATAAPWEYECDDEGWSMGWIGYQIPAGRSTVFSSIFAVEGDSAEQQINAELVVALRNNLPTILAALRTPDGKEAERASITYAPSGLEYAAVDQNDVWLLRFADQDCGDQWFGGDGYTAEEARALAIDAWNRYAPAWSVRLMRTVTLDEVRSAALSASRPVGEGWQPIESFVRFGQNNSVIVAVTCDGREPIVGEAWRLEDDGEWWWAGTSPGEYADSPISEINYGQVSHWQPLPEPPRSHEDTPNAS